MNAEPESVSVTFRLPPDQARYIRRLRGIEGDLTCSEVLSRLIDATAPRMAEKPLTSTKKARLHVNIPAHQVAMIDRLAHRAGMMRSQMIWRLIETAEASGFLP